MRKSILFILLFSCCFSAVHIQIQGNSIGGGVGLSFGGDIFPNLTNSLELGVEASYNSSQTNSYDTYTMADTTMAKYGLYLQITIPSLKQIPVLCIFAYPTFHIGMQSGVIDKYGVDRIFGDNSLTGNSTEDYGDIERKNTTGTYALIGFPIYYQDWAYIELLLGTHSLNGIGQARDTQIAIGLKF